MGKKITFIVPDISDARIIKRIKAFQILGADITVCGFRRKRYSYNESIYNDVNLIGFGETQEKSYFKRLPKLLYGFILILKNFTLFRDYKCIYCINIDMLILAIILRIRYKIYLYYEVGDILNAFLGKAISSRLLRKVERFLLKYTDLVILTSPAFYYQFYKKIQKIQFPWMLLENKLIQSKKPIKEKINYKKTKKISIVYHGVLRCRRSIYILTKVAAELSKKCELHIHGFPLWVNQNLLCRHSLENKNIFWHGEFKYPDGIKDVLSDADMLWLIDLSENQSNAKWLLPNRLYDGIYYRVPMLAMSDTETGKYIQKYNIGWCFKQNIYKELLSLVSDISVSEIIAKKKALDTLPSQLACSLEQHKKIYDSI